MAAFILEAENVEYTYPDGTRALKGLSMAIEKGQKVAVLGPNGAGKSTLFLHFNGILRPARGNIRFEGKEVRYDHSSLITLRKNVGIVFQDPDTQLFSASVMQEISFGPLNQGLTKEEVVERVHQAMVATGTAALRDRPTHFLSFGQKKLVSIAGVVAMQTSVLICDEPTAWLDPLHASQVLGLLDRCREEGTTVIISTHDVNLAFSWADYVLVMNDGSVVGEGTPDKVFQDENLLKKAELEKPWLPEVYEALHKKGWWRNGEPIPRTRRELVERIAREGAR